MRVRVTKKEDVEILRVRRRFRERMNSKSEMLIHFFFN